MAHFFCVVLLKNDVLRAYKVSIKIILIKGGSFMLVIGTDHGNKQMKSTNCPPFVSGLKESRTKPYGKDILEYQGKYYILSNQRIPYKRDKTEDEKFFVLTLFAIARELEFRNGFTKNILPIGLGVGLPPSFYGSLHKAFEKYFERGMVTFTYNGREQSIYLKDAKCYPQAYAAAITIFNELVNYTKVLIVDIGGFTADYLLMREGEADLSVCNSLENGIIILYNQISEKVNAEFDILLDEADMDAILEGKETVYSKEVVDIVLAMAEDFVEDLFNSLREKKVDLKSGVVVFVGGGGIRLKKVIEASEKIGKSLFVEDINANARGYEILYHMEV